MALPGDNDACVGTTAPGGRGRTERRGQRKSKLRREIVRVIIKYISINTPTIIAGDFEYCQCFSLKNLCLVDLEMNRKITIDRYEKKSKTKWIERYMADSFQNEMD